MVNHNLEAFNKTLSAEEREELLQPLSLILTQLNIILEKHGILSLKLEEISFVTDEELVGFDERLIDLSKRISIGLNNHFICAIMNKQLGNNTSDINSYNEGILGETTILNFVDKVFKKTLSSQSKVLELKYYQSYNEWCLQHVGAHYLSIKTQNISQNSLTVYLDCADKNWFLGMIKSLTVKA